MSRQFSTLDMHTGGEAVRIVTEGWPTIEGDTILAKRRFARTHHDGLRRLLMHEPRGHYDMYGVLPVTPSLPGADLAVLFIHNEGFSTMCGHAVIALGRYAVDHGLVPVTSPVTRVAIECPCGLVVAEVEVRNGRGGRVRFESVPAFAPQLDAEVQVPGFGPVRLDVAYGGAFYALVPVERLGLSLDHPVRLLTDAASAVTQAVAAALPPVYPGEPDLSFLYGTILTDGDNPAGTRNVCIFADREVDRSPTGSGVTARMAAMAAKGLVKPGDEVPFTSITGARFTGSLGQRTSVGSHAAVTVHVAGQAHYMGRHTFLIEEDDPFQQGFLLR
jgi:trans-L-3-hydroxyproline dehydratase